MRPIVKQFFLLSLLIIVVFPASAQKKIVKGVVTTFETMAVIDAEITVKSSKEVAMTDSLGRFAIHVDPVDKLKVTANGFYSQNVKVVENTKLVAVNLKLKPTEKAREYAIGYGHVRDSEKLNALSQMTSKDADFSIFRNIYDLIQGRFAGVSVQNNEIIIRGINSINSSSAALIVVDGVTVDGSALGSIPPSDVKSINVLKDGSAAIYGSRGANGVVIIETKRGNDE